MRQNQLKEQYTIAVSHDISKYELSENQQRMLRKCLLDMLNDVLQMCSHNGISIALAGGSALGAVRHQGFIPWDDDLDLMMPREDYMRFCELFDSELGRDYILVAPNHGTDYKMRFPKIMKRKTIFRALSDVDSNLQCGIFLDIFILENIPRNRIFRKIKGLACNALMFAGSRAYLYEHNNPVLAAHMAGTVETKRNWDRSMRFGRLFAMIPSRKWFNWTDKAVQFRNYTGILGLPTGRKHYFGEIMQEQTYLPFSKGLFEGYEVPLPADCDAYLKNLYGDYMQIPPPEKREKHYIQELKL